MVRVQENRTQFKQVCVQLSTSADDVALPAFARRTPLLKQSIDISCPPRPQHRTRSSAPAACRPSLGQTDRRTDRQMDAVPFHRPCSARYAGNAKFPTTRQTGHKALGTEKWQASCLAVPSDEYCFINASNTHRSRE